MAPIEKNSQRGNLPPTTGASSSADPQIDEISKTPTKAVDGMAENLRALGLYSPQNNPGAAQAIKVPLSPRSPRPRAFPGDLDPLFQLSLRPGLTAANTETSSRPTATVLEFTPPEGNSPRSIARSLKQAMGETHQGATLTATMPDGSRKIISWTADSDEFSIRPFPSDKAKMDSIFVSDFYRVGDRQLPPALVMVISNLEVGFTPSLTPDEFKPIDLKDLHIRARVVGLHQMVVMKPLLPPQQWMESHFEYIMEASSFRPTEPETAHFKYGDPPPSKPCGTVALTFANIDELPISDIELQLVKDNVIIDRYDMTADDIIGSILETFELFQTNESFAAEQKRANRLTTRAFLDQQGFSGVALPEYS